MDRVTFAPLTLVRLTPEEYARRQSKFFPDKPMMVVEVYPHEPEQVRFWDGETWCGGTPEPDVGLTLYVCHFDPADNMPYEFLGCELRRAE